MVRARLAVVGLWHLGSVAAAVLAERGHTVYATDDDRGILGSLQRGAVPVYEPGLAELIAQQIREGRLMFVKSSAEALAHAETILITIDTPINENDQCDLAPIYSAVDAIAREARGDIQVVIMSQVPVGTCHQLAARLRAQAPRLSFSLLYQPEDIGLGQALESFRHPDFQVIGADEPAAAQRLLDLYDGSSAPTLLMSVASAEMVKHSLNAFLATSISFANELAELAEACGADVRDIVRALRHDRRIGPHAFLEPGLGFSGGTLGRDVQSLRRLGLTAQSRTPLLDGALAVNAERLPRLADRIRRACGDLSGIRVAMFGLTYKPGTNTLRRSHALEFARMLLSSGATISAFGPLVTEPRAETQGIHLCSDPYQAAKSADVALLMTPCPEFRDLNLVRLQREMRQPVLVDAHNFFDPCAARAAGFRYDGFGIPQDTEAQGVCKVAR